MDKSYSNSNGAGGSFDEHLSILEKFRSDPSFSIYWKNWEICQNWANKCDETYLEYQKNVAWQRAQNDIEKLFGSGSGFQQTKTAAKDAEKGEDCFKATAADDEDIVMEEESGGSAADMSDYYRISKEHREQSKSLSHYLMH